MQVCPRTWGPRISRHDHLCNFLAIRLKSKCFDVRAEPVIPIETGTRKPDLVVWKEKDPWVVDVTIVGDNANLNECCDRKVRYYDSTRSYIIGEEFYQLGHSGT